MMVDRSMVDYQSLNRFEIDELTVGEMKREAAHFTRFIPSVGFVGVVFGPPDTNSTICSP